MHATKLQNFQDLPIGSKFGFLTAFKYFGKTSLCFTKIDSLIIQQDNEEPVNINDPYCDVVIAVED